MQCIGILYRYEQSTHNLLLKMISQKANSVPQGEKVKKILCYIKQRTQVWYLFAVALTFLSSSNRIKCRNEVHRTISKIFTTCNRGLVYAQRVGILKYRVSLTIGIGKRKTLTHCNLWQCNTTMKTLLHILLRLHWFTLYKYEKKHLRALLQKMLFYHQ